MVMIVLYMKGRLIKKMSIHQRIHIKHWQEEGWEIVEIGRAIYARKGEEIKLLLQK